MHLFEIIDHVYQSQKHGRFPLEEVVTFAATYEGLSPMQRMARLSDEVVRFALAHNAAVGSLELTYVAAMTDGKEAGVSSVGSRQIAAQIAFGLLQHLGGEQGVALPPPPKLEGEDRVWGILLQDVIVTEGDGVWFARLADGIGEGRREWIGTRTSKEAALDHLRSQLRAAGLLERPWFPIVDGSEGDLPIRAGAGE